MVTENLFLPTPHLPLLTHKVLCLTLLMSTNLNMSSSTSLLAKMAVGLHGCEQDGVHGVGVVYGMEDISLHLSLPEGGVVVDVLRSRLKRLRKLLL